MSEKSNLLGALKRFLLRPEDDFVRDVEPQHHLANAEEHSPQVALLASVDSALFYGSLLALKLANQHRSKHGLVGFWTGGYGSVPLKQAPATRVVRKRARRVSEVGLPLAMSGRLLRVHCSAKSSELEREANLLSAASSAPSVFVVSGPRDHSIDSLLASVDHVFVLGDGNGEDRHNEELIELAVKELSELNATSVSVWSPRISAVERSLALFGFGFGGLKPEQVKEVVTVRHTCSPTLSSI